MKGSSSPNDTPKPRKKLPKRPFFDSADRHEKLYGRSRLYASAQGRHETGGVLSLFSRLSFDISIQNSVQRWSSDFQGLFRVKIRKMAQGSDDLSTLPLRPRFSVWLFRYFLKTYVYTPSTPCRDVSIPLGDLSWNSLTEVMWHHQINGFPHSKFWKFWKTDKKTFT